MGIIVIINLFYYFYIAIFAQINLKTIKTMKSRFTKITAVLFALLLVAGGEASAQKTKCLKQIDSQIEGDVKGCYYNNDGSLDSLYEYSGYYDDDVYRLYSYDDRGNMTYEAGYGILEKDLGTNIYTKIFDASYEFDEKNRRISRTNYNIETWSGNFEMLLGGVYVYFYNDDDLLIKRQLFWDIDRKDLCETTDFIYDENNKLLKEVYMVKRYGSEVTDMEVTYTYDDNGRAREVLTNIYDYEQQELIFNSKRVYEYDDKGNLTTRTIWDYMSKKFPSEEHRLLYNDDIAADDVVFPINYEDDMDFYTLSKNAVKQDTIYRRDVDNTGFFLFDIQDWVYDEFTHDTGIENVKGGDVVLTLSRDGEGNITVNGLNDYDNIRIYDASGRIVRNGMYRGRIDTGSLSHGMYIIATPRGSVKFNV